jgi:hypothetical protein
MEDIEVIVGRRDSDGIFECRERCTDESGDEVQVA